MQQLDPNDFTPPSSLDDVPTGLTRIGEMRGVYSGDQSMWLSADCWVCSQRFTLASNRPFGVATIDDHVTGLICPHCIGFSPDE